MDFQWTHGKIKISPEYNKAPIKKDMGLPVPELGTSSLITLNKTAPAINANST